MGSCGCLGSVQHRCRAQGVGLPSISQEVELQPTGTPKHGSVMSSCTLTATTVAEVASALAEACTREAEGCERTAGCATIKQGSQGLLLSAHRCCCLGNCLCSNLGWNDNNALQHSKVLLNAILACTMCMANAWWPRQAYWWRWWGPAIGNSQESDTHQHSLPQIAPCDSNAAYSQHAQSPAARRMAVTSMGLHW